jgi:hypothetical protein
LFGEEVGGQQAVKIEARITDHFYLR